MNLTKFLLSIYHSIFGSWCFFFCLEYFLLITKSTRRYISLSFRFKLEIFLTIKSMNSEIYSSSLQKTPIVIGFNLGKIMSVIRFSISLQCRVFVLRHRSFLMPPPFLFVSYHISYHIISYSGRFTSESGTVW